MTEKQQQLEIVEHAISILENEEKLTPESREIYKDLIVLREKITSKNYIVSWESFWAIILRLLTTTAVHSILDHFK